MVTIKNITAKMAAVLGLLLFCVIFIQFIRILVLHANPALRIIGIYALYIASAALFIYVNKKFRLKTMFTIIGLFLLTFFYQFIFSIFTVMTYEGDLNFYFNNAVNFAKNGFAKPLFYQSTFPTTATYPAFLSFFMKIFGTDRLVPIILNQVVMSCVSCLSFFFLRRSMRIQYALAGAFLICLHPFTIIYSNTCNAELIFGALMLFAFFASIKSQESDVLRTKILWIALCGVLCGLSNNFRPLGIIMIIAIGMCLLLFSKTRFRVALLLTSILLVAFLLMQLGNALWQQRITHYPPASNGFGWNLYIGASQTGKWNRADSDVFADISSQASTPSELHSYFTKKAIERYQEMGPAGAIVHGFRKLSPWYAANYMADEAAMQSKDSLFDSSGERKTYFTLISIVDIPLFLAALASCLWILYAAIRSKSHDILPLVFYLLGSFLVLMVLEIAPRYTVSYRMVFCLLVTVAAGALFRRQSKCGHDTHPHT